MSTDTNDAAAGILVQLRLAFCKVVARGGVCTVCTGHISTDTVTSLPPSSAITLPPKACREEGGARGEVRGCGRETGKKSPEAAGWGWLADSGCYLLILFSAKLMGMTPTLYHGLSVQSPATSKHEHLFVGWRAICIFML